MMKLRQLEVFFVVAEELHFGRAAKRLCVVQPAVSQTIKALETELGVKLFDRSRRSTQLTEAGITFLKESQEAIKRLERAGQVAQQVANGESGQLRLGLTAVAALGLLPQAIYHFKQRYKGVVVQVEQMGTLEQCRALSLGEIDLGFTVMFGGYGDLSSEALSEEALVAILPIQHPFASQEEIPLCSLLKEPLISMSQRQEPAIHRAYHRLCREYSCTPNVVMELDHLESMFAFVAAGLGVSLAPATALKLHFEGVVGRPLSPRYPAGVSIVWNPEKLSPVTTRFLADMRTLRDGA